MVVYASGLVRLLGSKKMEESYCGKYLRLASVTHTHKKIMHT